MTLATHVVTGEDAAVATLKDRVSAAIEYAMAANRIKSMRDIPRAVEFAGLGEMSHGYMSTLTTRLRKDPESGDPKSLRLVAIVCGVRPNWLIWGDGEMLDETNLTNVARERVARASMTVPDQPAQETLERVLDAFDWPNGMTPVMVANVIRDVKASATKAHEVLPEKFWFAEVTRLSREELGTAKAVKSPEHDATADARDAEDLAKHRAAQAAKKSRKKR